MGNESSYRVIGHSRDNPCPRCKKRRFCDDCGLCEACGFASPEVDVASTPCKDCGRVMTHTRACVVTARAAAN